MTTLDYVFGIILLVAAVFLVIAVLMQSGKSHNLSGAIAGGTDSYLGKNGGTAAKGKMLSKLTTIVAIVFVAIVLVAYFLA